MPVFFRPLAVVCAAALLAACPGGRDADTGRRVQIDTANDDWEDGLSAEQVREEAEALSPEQAARAGLAVDTSIHLEELGPRDAAPGQAPRDAVRDSVPVVDTASP